MRLAVPLVLALVLVPAVDAAGWNMISYGQSTVGNWFADAFTAEGPSIWVRFGHVSDDELVGHVISLYDGDDRYLASRVFVGIGGRMLDVTTRAPGAGVTTDNNPGLSNHGEMTGDMVFHCDAACNPSRQFKIAVTAGGKLDVWGYGLFVLGNGSVTARANGTESWAYHSRDFDGAVAHATFRGAGVSVVQDARRAIHADDMLIGAFVKGGAPPSQMSVISASGERTCPCFFGDWPAGDHTFRHSYTDTNGREAYLVVADVDLP